MTSETVTRWALGLVLLALPVGLVGAWGWSQTARTTLHGRVSADGGWTPSTLTATVGQPLDLRLVSEDVIHGFAIGRTNMAPIELPPGQAVMASLIFTRPGTYTYYCTRWCGADHWRMRGVIEVTGEGVPVPPPPPALYLSLGIDLDAEHPAASVPLRRPSAARGAAMGVSLPEGNRERQDFVRRSPAEIWQSLRRDPATSGLSDADVWDLVANYWRSTTSAAALDLGAALYAPNCAACHGEDGAGEGVMAPAADEHESEPAGHADSHSTAPADFTDPTTMLGASSAWLQGKLVRGGMGTGMPYWGPILTDSQTWALTDYLWTFQFEEGR